MLTRKSKSLLTIVKKIKTSFKTAVIFSLSPKSIIGLYIVTPKNTNKYGVRRFTVNILVSTQVNVDGFLKKTFSATFKIVNYYHIVKGEKGEYFIKKKGF